MLRAFLLTENTLIRDGDFSLERVLERTNEFSDIYGNLIMRSLSKNIAGPVLDHPCLQLDKLSTTRNCRLDNLVEAVTKQYDACCFSDGFDLIMKELRQVSFFTNSHLR